MSKYDLDLDYVFPAVVSGSFLGCWKELVGISWKEIYAVIAEVERKISENKENPEVLAKAYLKKAQCVQKIEEYNTAYYFPTYLLFIRSFYKHKYHKERIKKLIEKQLELNPDMPEALMLMGKLYHNTSKEVCILDNEDLNPKYIESIDKAINWYTKAIQLKPDYAAAFYNRGNLYSEAWFSINSLDGGDSEKAISNFTDAIRLRPLESIYYFERGKEYSKMEIHGKAIEDFSSAIHYGSDEFNKRTNVFYERGSQYMKLKNYEKAINDLSESIRLRPDENKTLLMRKNAYYRSGNQGNAKADFDEYLRRTNNKILTKGKCTVCGLPFTVLPEEKTYTIGPIGFVEDKVCKNCKENGELNFKSEKKTGEQKWLTDFPSDEEIVSLLHTYKEEIHITPDDYQRLLYISNRMVYIDEYHPEIWLDTINILENLLK